MQHIAKVISGGQTGADQGGLEAAARVGIPTGGWMPRGWLTETGHNPTLAERFGLQEHTSDKYSPRTAKNIHDADVTIIFAAQFDSGSGLTLRLCDKMDKARWVIFDDPEIDEADVLRVVNWLMRQSHLLGRAITVNIAGNRESRSPGIQMRAAILFHQIFTLANAD